jgi:demethoxyubiquinone hydroxylase (CLK1/Coq7/Cat5 family)
VFFIIFSQLRELLEKNPEKHTELLEIIKKFRDEEMEHHDTGLAYDAEKVKYLNIFTPCFNKTFLNNQF